MKNDQLVETAESLIGEQVIVKFNDDTELQGLLNRVMFNDKNYEFAIELTDKDLKGILISLVKIFSIQPVS